MPLAEATDRYVSRLPTPAIREILDPNRFEVPLQIRLPFIQTFPSRIYGHVCIPATDVLRDANAPWRSEERSQAQQIIPHLWLGPLSAARDSKFLTEAKISMAVVVRYVHPSSPPFVPVLAMKTFESLSIQIYTIDVNHNRHLIAALPAAFQTIDQHHVFIQGKTGHLGQVFVCDLTGNEFAAAVTTAFILRTTEIAFQEAVDLVQVQRNSVYMDIATAYTLHTYKTLIDAGRDVDQAEGEIVELWNKTHTESTSATTQAHLQHGTKRTFDEAGDDEDENNNTEVNDDVLAIPGHSSQRTVRMSSPFVDT